MLAYHELSLKQSDELMRSAGSLESTSMKIYYFPLTYCWFFNIQISVTYYYHYISHVLR